MDDMDGIVKQHTFMEDMDGKVKQHTFMEDMDCGLNTFMKNLYRPASPST